MSILSALKAIFVTPAPEVELKPVPVSAGKKTVAKKRKATTKKKPTSKKK